MTICEIRKRIKAIMEKNGDDEAQHAMQDDLWQDVLCFISEDTRDANKLAIEALRVLELDFERWCA